MSPTEIRANGSKMLGEASDSVEALLDVLARHPLHRTFERTFIQTLTGGVTRFQGNFLTISHVFDIRSYDPEVVRRLTDAILANRRTRGFRSQPSASRQLRAIQQWHTRKPKQVNEDEPNP